MVRNNRHKQLCYKKHALFWASIFLLIIVKLYLVSGQTLSANGGEAYDDKLFIDLANNISNGNWLGEYNNRTLIKGPFYPLWIAINYKLGMPLLFSQHLLYILSCVTFIGAIASIVRIRYLLLIFVFILFNPISYSGGVMTYVLRSGIYQSLSLIMISICIYFVLNYKYSQKINLFLFICFGIFLSAFWLTREESIWIIPFIVITYIVIFLKLVTASYSLRFITKQILLLILPFFILLISIVTVSGLNKHYYGISTYNEPKSSFFKAAYGALIRVKHQPWQPAVPLPEKVRKEIYSVSPAFYELKPFLDGEFGKRWRHILYNVKSAYNNGKLDPIKKEIITSFLRNDQSGIWHHVWDKPQKNEYYGPWFIWALRDAVTAAGYTSATAAKQFYLRLADEINLACKDKKLDCLSARSTLIPPWRSEYTVPLFKTFLNSIYYLITYSEFSAGSGFSAGESVSIDLFKKMTNEQLSPFPFESEKSANNKIVVLNRIGYLYQTIVPYLVLLTTILYFWVTVRYFKRIFMCDFWIITTIIMITILFVLFSFSFVHITSFPAILVRYLTPLYLLVKISLIFAWLTFGNKELWQVTRR
jgi:hypothetical protein